MARIAKGSAMTAAVLGVLSFIFGLSMAICSWVLNGKVSNFWLSTASSDPYSSDSNVSISFNSYWWGGLFYLVPGICGIIAGCTRNVCAMITYMIFNILCLISSVIVSVLMAVLILAWAVIETLSNQGNCMDQYSMFTSVKNCVCDDYNGNKFTIHNMSCNDVKGIQTILGAIVALASISSLLAFIASYVSCCALCNQEQETQGTVIIQPGAGHYQPPANVIVTNTTSSNQQYAHHQQPQYPGYAQQPYAQPPQYGQQPPPQYAQQPPPQQYVQTYDKANLMKNEVI